MKNLRKIVKQSIKKYLNESFTIDISELNDNFWKWFGNSKIVENGKPLIVYHGSSDNNIKSFDLNLTGKNTDSGMYGKGFYFTNDIKYASTYNRNTEKGSVLSCYLSIKNPLIINNKNDIPKIDTNDQTIEDFIDAPNMYSEKFRNFLIKNNYDGVIDNISSIKQFVALYPNQIKSTKNDGSFDLNDNNIYS